MLFNSCQKAYIGAVRKLHRFFIFWILILSLGTVLVGSYFSFHVDNAATGSHLTQCDVVKFHADVSQAEDGHGDHDDSCAQGFCHLGHCASVVVPSWIVLTFASEQDISYIRFEQSIVSRFLEGPFQPPKSI